MKSFYQKSKSKRNIFYYSALIVSLYPSLHPITSIEISISDGFGNVHGLYFITSHSKSETHLISPINLSKSERNVWSCFLRNFSYSPIAFSSASSCETEPASGRMSCSLIFKNFSKYAFHSSIVSYFVRSCRKDWITNGYDSIKNIPQNALFIAIVRGNSNFFESFGQLHFNTIIYIFKVVADGLCSYSKQYGYSLLILRSSRP